jgi:hypothetical protein
MDLTFRNPLAVIFLSTLVILPAAAQAGHGFGGGHHHGGFGGGWGGIANRAMHGGHHYHQPQRHYQHQGHQYYQPQQQYYQPRTNYVYPQAKPQPVAPRVNVVSQVHKVPPKTPVKTNVVPQPIAKSVPPQKTTPKTNVVPQPVAKSTASPPPQKPQPKQPAPANPGISDLVGMPTQADLDRMIDQISDRDLQLIDQLIDLIDALDDLLNQQDILDTLGDIRDELAGDDFGGDDLANLFVAIQDTGLPPDTLQPLIDLLTQIAIDQQVIDWLLATDPGFGDVPFGPDIPLVLLPGIPDGLLIPLADGPVIIGMGAPGDEILLGMGNPFEVAGLPIPEEGAEPAAEVAAPFAAGQIILANWDLATINYNLNGQPQQLAPRFEQTLTAGTTWTVEFDRGNGFGTATYQLSEGFYYFMSTDRGWDLFKKTFRVTLDNADNTFAFNYVVDDQPQTINPGESHDLTGPFPPVVRFDNGNGEELQRRLENGSYQVAITEEMTMDIYKSEDVISPQPDPAVGAPVAAAAPASRAAMSQAAAPAPRAVAQPASATARSLTAAAPVPTAIDPAGNTGLAKSGARKKKGTKLPAGFTLFEPMKALSDARTARRLPPAFTLFRSAAEQVPVARKNAKE